MSLEITHQHLGAENTKDEQKLRKNLQILHSALAVTEQVWSL